MPHPFEAGVPVGWKPRRIEKVQHSDELPNYSRIIAYELRQCGCTMDSFEDQMSGELYIGFESRDSVGKRK